MGLSNAKIHKYDLLYAGLQGSYWAYYASVWSFIAVILGFYGFSGKAVGTLTALATLLSVVVQPILAARADRSERFRSREMAMALMLMGFGVGLALLLAPLSLGPRGVLFWLLGLILSCISPFLNSLATDLMARGEKLNYGFGRGFGSLCYAITVMIVGSFVEKQDPKLELTVFLIILIPAILIMYCCRLPEGASREKETEKALGTIEFLKANPAFIIALLGAAFFVAGHNIYNTYYYAVIDRAALAGTLVMGTTLGIEAIVELPAMSLFPTIHKHISCEMLLTFAGIGIFIKSVLYVFCTDGPMLYVNAVLQFFENGLYLPAAVFFVKEHIATADQSKGQGLMYAAGGGLGGALGNYCGGFLLDHFSIVASLLFGALCGLLCALCFYICKRRRKAVQYA